MLIPYGKQYIDDSDINAVISVFKSNYITQGPKIHEFENAICEYTGAEYCIAVSNGTAALHLSVKALELEKKSVGITSPISFVASSNCLIYSGLIPKFVDINTKTYNIDPDLISSSVTENTKLIIPVHFAGQPADMEKIYQLGQANDLYIIEDAAHAIGSGYENGKKVGSCMFSDMTIFSFHPVKTVTTIEGGAITTNNKLFYDRLQLLRNHGITKSPELLSSNPGPWFYEMQSLGFNYRMTDVQAALGINQLNRIEKYIERRRDIIKTYNKAFEKVDWLTTPFERKEIFSAFHLYVLQFDFVKLDKSRKQVMIELRDKGIGTQVHYIPIYWQPYYQKNYNTKKGDCPLAEKYYQNTLSLPLYPAMTNENVEYVIENILMLNN